MSKSFKPKRKEIIEAFQNPNTYGTTVLSICLAQYGEDTFTEDAVEIYARLSEDFGTYLHDALESKLQALITAITTPYFMDEPEIFTSISKTLLTGDPGLSEFIPDTPTLLEILWAIYEVGLSTGDDDEEFSPAVQNVIDLVIQNESIQNEDLPVTVDAITLVYQTGLEEMAEELSEELQRVGFEKPVMPPINV